MKIKYDQSVDALYIILDDSATYENTVKVTDNVLVDYSKDGEVVGIELLAASEENIVKQPLQKNVPIQTS